jgi:hypothetical protein
MSYLIQQRELAFLRIPVHSGGRDVLSSTVPGDFCEFLIKSIKATNCKGGTFSAIKRPEIESNK